MPGQPGAPGEFGANPVVQGEDLLRPCDGLPTGIGQDRSPPRAVEEVGSELLLQSPDVKADRGLGQADDLGGADERAMLRDGHQGTKGSKGHSGPFA